MDRAPVQLFVTCLVDGFFPQVGIASLKLLERTGADVAFPSDQTCCGQPAFNAGYHDQAQAMVRHTLDVLDATEGPIVIPSGSCAAMLVHHAHQLVTDDPPYAAKAGRVAARIRELTSYLADQAVDVGAGSAFTGAITYHPSCHGMRGLGLTDEPTALLDGVPGADRIPLPDADECCGFGGLFSIKMPDVSAAILNTKLDNIEATGAGFVVGGDVSCLMHMGGGLRRRGTPIEIRHVAEILAEGAP
jgi:L-lactate dehydrogenase complex protein LldE